MSNKLVNKLVDAYITTLKMLRRQIFNNLEKRFVGTKEKISLQPAEMTYHNNSLKHNVDILKGAKTALKMSLKEIFYSV